MSRPLSIYLDLVRFTAALVVFLGHAARGPAGGSGGLLWQLTVLANDAVTVFFVLSGFVIAHVVSTSERGPRHFFTNRAARIYSVAVPAVLLTAALDYLGSIINPSFGWYGKMHPQLLPMWLPIALTFTDQLWHADVQIGTNTPYWSLAFEVWYYILFGCALFAPRRWAVFGCLIVAVLLGPGIMILLPVWLAGAATYRVVARISRPHEGVGWALFLCSTILIIALFYWFIAGHDIAAPQVYRLVSGKDITMDQANAIFTGQASWPRRYVVGMLFAVHLVGFCLVQHRFASVLQLCAYPIRWIAGMTFSLYLFHFPVLTFLAAVLPGAPSDMTRRISMICIPLVVVAGLAQVTERKKSAWRRVIDAVVTAGMTSINRRRYQTPVTLGDPH